MAHCAATRSSGWRRWRLRLVAGEAGAGPGLVSQHRAPCSTGSSAQLRPAVAACGAAEIAGLLAGLDGRFVAPGPSGAPSRGRPEVLPTGRNFYSVDTRAVPTPAAWQLGWHSAALLVERYAQEHGNYPARARAVGLGHRQHAHRRRRHRPGAGADRRAPGLGAASGRVTGFEILPASVLDRPRVDVTLRISGFFRDAFPGLIDLFDSAARAVAALDEPATVNPLAARVAADRRALEAAGVRAGRGRAARRLSHLRLEAGRLRRRAADADRRADLAGRRRSRRGLSRLGRLCLWRGRRGPRRARPARSAARRRPTRCCTTRTTASTTCSTATTTTSSRAGSPLAVRHLSGRAPAVYHNDHSRPERPRIRSLREEIRPRRARPRRQPALDRRRHAPRLQGRRRDRRDGRLSVCLRRNRARRRRCHFDALYDAYLGDDAVRGFMAEHNPAALAETERRFARRSSAACGAAPQQRPRGLADGDEWAAA